MVKKDSTAAAAKPEAKVRKKPERHAPVQKDYPNKLAWLKAMTEYEEAQTATANKAKVARLDKRIASVTEQRDDLNLTLQRLQAQRAELVPAEDTEQAGEQVDGDGGQD